MDDWSPPSLELRLQDGVRRCPNVPVVSYPSEGNDFCIRIEDGSYCFAHCNECIWGLLSLFPPSGDFYAAGGGNGFVSLSLQKDGIASDLIELESGVRNARQRGLALIIDAALEDSGFASKRLPAAVAFDGIEDFDDGISFFRTVHRTLRSEGRFDDTVPAGPGLEYNDDVYAGHYRRHSCKSITDRLRAVCFEVEITSCFFA
jgi:hypothetical protein